MHSIWQRLGFLKSRFLKKLKACSIINKKVTNSRLKDIIVLNVNQGGLVVINRASHHCEPGFPSSPSLHMGWVSVTSQPDLRIFSAFPPSFLPHHNRLTANWQSSSGAVFEIFRKISIKTFLAISFLILPKFSFLSKTWTGLSSDQMGLASLLGSPLGELTGRLVSRLSLVWIDR